jgi:hypothetical protein
MCSQNLSKQLASGKDGSVSKLTGWVAGFDSRRKQGFLKPRPVPDPV